MGELLNLVGLSTGVVLYAMLLTMVLRADRTTRVPRVDTLLLVTSILGLVWNLAALPAYELPKLGIRGSFSWLVAAGFSALGFLPAVVVHSVLRGEQNAVRGWLKASIATAAYAVSTTAVFFHLRAVFAGSPVPSARGMRLLTYAFGLRNVERRLACQYRDAAALTIHTARGRGTTVEIRLPVGIETMSEKHLART